jgi:hypothetical protein
MVLRFREKKRTFAKVKGGNVHFFQMEMKKIGMCSGKRRVGQHF